MRLGFRLIHFLIFKTKERKLNQQVSIEINEQPVDLVKHTKFLGVCIDEGLPWKYHIGQFTSKISKITGVVAKARHYLSFRTSKAIYDTMVCPYWTILQYRLVKYVSNQAKAIIFDTEKIS